MTDPSDTQSIPPNSAPRNPLPATAQSLHASLKRSQRSAVSSPSSEQRGTKYLKRSSSGGPPGSEHGHLNEEQRGRRVGREAGKNTTSSGLRMEDPPAGSKISLLEAAAT